jgi:hypothetical protein
MSALLTESIRLPHLARTYTGMDSRAVVLTLALLIAGTGESAPVPIAQSLPLNHALRPAVPTPTTPLVAAKPHFPLYPNGVIAFRQPRPPAPSATWTSRHAVASTGPRPTEGPAAVRPRALPVPVPAGTPRSLSRAAGHDPTGITARSTRATPRAERPGSASPR